MELTNAAISGENAAPAGDGVPNLVKYYLYLPAKTIAPSERLPQGSLSAVSNLLHLALIRRLHHRRLAWRARRFHWVDRGCGALCS
jgi:hypothetical protein